MAALEATIRMIQHFQNGSWAMINCESWTYLEILNRSGVVLNRFRPYYEGTGTFNYND